MRHLSLLWNQGVTAKYLVCNHNPRQIVQDFGFHVTDMDVKVPCAMHGSGEGKTFYFYKRRERKQGKTQTSSHGSLMPSLLTGQELESLGNSNIRKMRLEAIDETLEAFMNEPKAKRRRNIQRYTA